MRGLLAGKVPPEGPWELQGIELLSQKELHCQILLLLHLLPQDLLLLQVGPPQPTQSCASLPGRGRALPARALWRQAWSGLPEVTRMPVAPQPCQSSYCYCQEVLDRLIQCGLLVAEEVGRGLQTEAPAWGPAPPLPRVGGWGRAAPAPAEQTPRSCRHHTPPRGLSPRCTGRT